MSVVFDVTELWRTHLEQMHPPQLLTNDVNLGY